MSYNKIELYDSKAYDNIHNFFKCLNMRDCLSISTYDNKYETACNKIILYGLQDIVKRIDDILEQKPNSEIVIWCTNSVVSDIEWYTNLYDYIKTKNIKNKIFVLSCDIDVTPLNNTCENIEFYCIDFYEVFESSSKNKVSFEQKDINLSFIGKGIRANNVITLFYLLQNNNIENMYYKVLNDYNKNKDINFILDKIEFYTFENNITYEQEQIMIKTLLDNFNDSIISDCDFNEIFKKYAKRSIFTIINENFNNSTPYISRYAYCAINNKNILFVNGGKNYLENLKRKGYDTFDDLINNNYDCEEHWVERLHRMLQELEKVKNIITHKEYMDRVNNNKQILNNKDFKYLKEKLSFIFM